MKPLEAWKFGSQPVKNVVEAKIASGTEEMGFPELGRATCAPSCGSCYRRPGGPGCTHHRQTAEWVSAPARRLNVPVFLFVGQDDPEPGLRAEVALEAHDVEERIVVAAHRGRPLVGGREVGDRRCR